MRTALIAALRHSPEGPLRAALPLAGRSVLARQAELMLAQRCERVLCLCGGLDPEVLRVQAAVEQAGATFQALRGHLHLPALIRAEDELVILADGLVPDPEALGALFAPGPRFVASLPEGSPLLALHPQDFERIDAERHWAGLLVMRGAPVQQLADFPPDVDAVSLLLRLALQAGTPCRELPESAQDPGCWLLADSAARLAEQEQAMIRAASGPVDWHAPGAALASLAARRLAPDWLARGPLIAIGVTVLLLACGVAASAGGAGAIGLGLAAGGALGAGVARALGTLRQRLIGERPWFAAGGRPAAAVDLAAALTLWLALAPWPPDAPLAVLGAVTVGLARLFAAAAPSAPLAPLADRPVLLGLLALAGGFGLLPLASALAALLFTGGLLLRSARN
ncbi:MAG: hypothetical protein GC147_00835 [Porphyrobacter sp.]|nr:hypothetical protein [Porphyrobacter sp.]